MTSSLVMDFGVQISMLFGWWLICWTLKGRFTSLPACQWEKLLSVSCIILSTSYAGLFHHAVFTSGKDNHKNPCQESCQGNSEQISPEDWETFPFLRFVSKALKTNKASSTFHQKRVVEIQRTWILKNRPRCILETTSSPKFVLLARLRHLLQAL